MIVLIFRLLCNGANSMRVLWVFTLLPLAVEANTDKAFCSLDLKGVELRDVQSRHRWKIRGNRTTYV